MFTAALNLNAQEKSKIHYGTPLYIPHRQKIKLSFVKAHFLSRKDAHDILFNVNKKLQNSIMVCFYFMDNKSICMCSSVCKYFSASIYTKINNCFLC